MGTRAAGGYVGMSEGWLGTVCALFLRSFNAATTLLKERKNNIFPALNALREIDRPEPFSVKIAV